MKKLSKAALITCTVAVCLILMSHTVLGAAAEITKTVTPIGGGGFLVRIKVRATGSSIYALKLSDPQAGILDVYAPKGWCIVADDGDFLSRTAGTPITSKRSIEFIIYSSTDDIKYSWAVFDPMKQIGKPGTL